MKAFLIRLLMALVAFTLVVAVYVGLQRMGWELPTIQPAAIIAHGPLMVSGVLGSLIALERAVALSANRKSGGIHWSFASPFLGGLGAIALVINPLSPIGRLLITLSSLVFVLITITIVRQQTAPYTVVMAVGGGAWLVGNVLWLTEQPIYSLVYWWIGYLVLTIVAERLELARVVRATAMRQRTFLGATGLFLLGIVLTLANQDLGTRLAGLGEIALGLWLLNYDIARRTVKQKGLTRFIAACLLGGYVWLCAGGILAVINGSAFAGLYYDALLHTVFLGFVFSMIFGHAPVIIPALLKVAVPFHPSFYLHLGLLHLSLVVRIGSDLAGDMTGRQWGGMLNMLALLLFIVNTAIAVRGAARRSLVKPASQPTA